MPSIPTIISQRRERHQHTQKSFSRRILNSTLGLGLILSIAATIAILAGTWFYANLTSDLPSVQMLPILLNPENGTLLQPTRLYDRSGQQLLYTIAPNNEPRTFVKYADIPKSLVNATIVLGDPGFWKHPGFTLEDWRISDRHATLAQKLVSDLLLFNEPASIQRSIRERLLAGQITAEYGREKVMEWYLNSAYFGHQVYGVQAASLFYFGIPANDLDLSQSAMLAAISQAPALNPVDTPQYAEQRRLETLQIMLAFNLVDADQVAQAGGNPPEVKPVTITSTNISPAFTSMVLTQLGKKFNRERIERGGLIILTTMDFELQNQVDCSLRIQLIRLGAQKESPVVDCPAANLLPPLPSGVSAGGTAANALVMDTTTGQILAVSGQGGTNHPAGTILSPFIFLTGFTRGMSPSSLGWDIPGKQVEFDQEFKGPVSLRSAMVNDYLGPAVQIETQMGSDNTWNIAHIFGLHGSSDSLLRTDLSLPLLEVAGAYATFSNQGIMTGQIFQSNKPEPYSVLKLSSLDHVTWGDWSFPEKQAVVSPGLAYLVNNILSDETTRWPSLGQSNPFGIGRPAAFKLGRTLDGSGTWTVGYTPQRLVLVWLEGNNSSHEISVSLPAAGLWRSLMLTSVSELPEKSWDIPTGIVNLYVCDPSGLLPSPICPNVTNEVFLSGNEPDQIDTLYQSYQVNQETGFLATIFTPFELVEERVFMNVPPEAEAWAKNAGIQIPPSEYDTILQPSPQIDAHINLPLLFADVRGQLQITGSAMGADFSYYRLEYGLGLNPQEWIQIGTDITKPIEEGLLANWDTNGINGLIATRLMVVHKDKSVEIATTQLLVDNTPPKISILSLAEGDEIILQPDQGIVLQAEVNDPNLVNVKMYMDGILAGEFSNPPFSLLWQASKGSHTLRLLAVDRAGNQTELKIKFKVN
jgi:membrane peptidoglycan carboxypeptidase